MRLRFRKALIPTGSWSMLPVIGGLPLGCELAQLVVRFGSRTLTAHREPLFLPQEQRDAAQMVADALARDGVEIHLNNTASKVWMEGAEKVVELANDGNTAEMRVDPTLTGIGRVPAVQGLKLEAAGVAYDAHPGCVSTTSFAPATRGCLRADAADVVHGQAGPPLAAAVGSLTALRHRRLLCRNEATCRAG